MKMRALQSHPWAHETKRAGDEYEANDREADMLLALGWAEKVEDAPRRTLRLNTRDMRASHSGPTYETKATE